MDVQPARCSIDQSSTSRGDRTGGTRAAAVRAVVFVAAVACLGLATTGCSDSKFAVGECVKTRNGITNDDMKKADCKKSSLQDQLDGEGVYKISSIVDLNKRCPRSTEITFNYEPHDATYCLNSYR